MSGPEDVEPDREVTEVHPERPDAKPIENVDLEAPMKAEDLNRPAAEVAEEDESVAELIRRGLRSVVTEERTDAALEWADEVVDVPYVPDQLVFRTLDAMLPEQLLKLVDRLLDSIGLED